MSAYFKTLVRTVRNNIGRFVAITAIIALGIAFVSGLGTLTYKMEASLNEFLQQNQVADIIVKSTSTSGLSEEQIDKIRDNDAVSAVQALTAMDMDMDGVNSRIYVLPLANLSVNKLSLQEGRLPSSYDEILVERSSDYVKERAIGDEIFIKGFEISGKELPDITLKIVGIVGNPLIMCTPGEPDIINQKPLEQILYLDEAKLTDLLAIMNIELPKTDLHVRIDQDIDNVFSQKYEDNIAAAVSAIDADMQDDTLAFLTLQDNASIILTKSYADKINVVALIFPVFFVAVAALVVSTTMTRMIEEERASMGCCKTLGFGDGKIAFKYVGFSALCCIIGSAIGIGVGLTLLPAVIMPAFTILFFMPPIVAQCDVVLGVVAVVAMWAVLMLLTGYIVHKELKSQPADLLRPKAPKAGRKIFLEKIPFIWKRLPFSYKSTFRNIFRNVKHLVMTVVSVAGSTALIFAGFALYDVSKAPEGMIAGMADTFSLISGVVIAFAVLLCALVVYNLVNMNIGERKREIATLKVLGYQEFEVAAYIYREIMIMAIIGIVIGLPLGFGLMAFLFYFLEFGRVQDIQWYSYVVCGAIVIAVIGTVEAVLWRKINNIDMISSLKSVE